MDGPSDPDPLENMKQRSEMCLRLAKSITDEQASKALRQMAIEIEADIQTLLSERAAKASTRKAAHEVDHSEREALKDEHSQCAHDLPAPLRDEGDN